VWIILLLTYVPCKLLAKFLLHNKYLQTEIQSLFIREQFIGGKIIIAMRILEADMAWAQTGLFSYNSEGEKSPHSPYFTKAAEAVI
jgi:hypothetical protein